LDDDEIVRVLGESILAATIAVREGKPQTGLDMIEIVIGALPPENAEPIELAALPTKIIALIDLERLVDAQTVLARMENLAALHGTTDDLQACRLLRDRMKQRPVLTNRGIEAMEAIEAGNPEGVTALEAVAREALDTDQHVVAIGALVYLGKLYADGGNHLFGRGYLMRAKDLLERNRQPTGPIDDETFAKAMAQIEQTLATLPTPSS
jgi:hypothetical protein